MKHYPILGFITLSFLLAACNFSLAADITPPPGSQMPTLAPAQPEQISGPLYPLVPPDPVVGRPIYLEKCAPCHGETGLGDGDRSAGLPNPVAPIGHADLARMAAPAQWFTIVSQGNLEKFMPPFPSLNDRQRWDVVAYAFTLSQPAQSVQQGQLLYQSACANCHGASGKGDGPDGAALAMPSFTDQEFMSGKSGLDLYNTIANGTENGMPEYASQYAEQEIWSLADYLRSLSFATTGELAAAESTPVPGEIPPASSTLTETQVVSPTLPAGIVTGTVANLSGGQLPVAEEVILHGFDNMQLVISQTIPLAADGTFSFENIELPPGRMFFTSLQHQGVTYGSEVVTVAEGQQSIQLPVTVYDATTDASGLKIDRLHLFFEQVDEKTMRVAELFVMSNSGNKTIVATGDGDPSIKFKLPAGAADLQFQEGELGGRFIQTEDGFGDLAPVYPGSGTYQMLLAFTLPFNHKVDLNQKLSYPADALVVLVPQESFKVKGQGLEMAGVNDVDGVPYQMYSGASVAAGDSLKMTVSSSSSLLKGSNLSLVVGLVALGLVLFVLGAWLYRQQRKAQPEGPGEFVADMPGMQNGSAETLMDAILALDDSFAEGKIPEEAYRQRRAELKARLQALKNQPGA